MKAFLRSIPFVADASAEVIVLHMDRIFAKLLKMCKMLLLSNSQGRRELFEAQGQTENRGPLRAKRAEDFFRLPPLDWLKMHLRAFPVVKMSEFSNCEAT